MRAVVTRVSVASVTVAGERIAEIGPGLLVLVGVTHADEAATVAAMARKIHGLRILREERSIADDPTAAVLVVSQFTLYADTGKGRRPSWSAAAPAETAAVLVDELVRQLRHLGTSVQTGRFGADMAVESVNDGPVTILLEF